MSVTLTIPIPLISMNPLEKSLVYAVSSSPTLRIFTWSSAMRAAPRSTRPMAVSLLPEPLFPLMRTPNPLKWIMHP